MATEEIYNQLAQQIGPEIVNKFATITGIPTNTSIIIIACFLVMIVVWTYIWKGIALWKSVINRHKIWFVVILVLNTVGILEILYIYVFSKMDWNNITDKKQKINKRSNVNKNPKKKKR